MSTNGYSQVDSTAVERIDGASIGYRKETILKRRIKKESKKEIVIKGYYQEVIGMTTQMDSPQPVYGKKKRFRRVESTVRDKGFRRKFGI